MDSLKSTHRRLVYSQLGIGIAPKQTSTEQFRLELLPEGANSYLLKLLFLLPPLLGPSFFSSYCSPPKQCPLLLVLLSQNMILLTASPVTISPWCSGHKTLPLSEP